MDRLRLLELALSEAFLPANPRDVGDFLRHEEEARLAGIVEDAPKPLQRPRPADCIASPMSAARALDHGAGF
jgi:hypothetical protein